MRPSFPTDHQSILERMQSIAPEQYAKTRNFNNGSVSCLSPYISRGVLTLPQIWNNLKERGYTIKTATKFIQELAWREYFQRTWWHLGKKIMHDIRQPQQDVLHQELQKALTDGATGIHAIDEGIRTLFETGYAHNHLRMYIAGISCNLAKAHWKLPATWMYYHLLDGDIASNTLSWQWVAGTFSNKKYIANQDNINYYLNSNQKRTFLDISYEEILKQPVPEALQNTWRPEFATILPETAPPKIRTDLPVFLYNSYWLNPDWHADLPANRLLILDPAHFKQFPVSKKVLDFILELAVDCIPDIQVVTGSPRSIPELAEVPAIYSVEHPLTVDYPGIKEPYPWLFPDFKGTPSSYFNFWKKVSYF